MEVRRPGARVSHGPSARLPLPRRARPGRQALSARPAGLGLGRGPGLSLDARGRYRSGRGREKKAIPSRNAGAPRREEARGAPAARRDRTVCVCDGCLCRLHVFRAPAVKWSGKPGACPIRSRAGKGRRLVNNSHVMPNASHGKPLPQLSHRRSQSAARGVSEGPEVQSRRPEGIAGPMPVRKPRGTVRRCYWQAALHDAMIGAPEARVGSV